MKRYVRTVGLGLVIGLVLVGVYELAGGDATIVVLLVLLAAHIKVRLDELRDTLETMRAADPTERCGNDIQDPLSGEAYMCTKALGHASPWHADDTPIRWRHQP